MKLFPTDDISRFQAFSLLFLVALLASTFIGTVAFGVTLALFAVLCISLSRPLSAPQRRQAYALFCVFALLGAGALAAGNVISSPEQALGFMPFLAIGFLALYVIVKLYVVSWEVECKVVGYSGGYAIVDVAPSVLSVVPAGILAVKSRPVAKGKKARLLFKRKLFGSAPRPSGLEISA
ncbi:MAG: hypothetical protein WCX64_00420 [Candidatus Micrarchaeia archaeon]|jgi:hypothetical protein